MIFNTNSKEYQLYFHYIKSVSSLSKLFSESDIPFLHYRLAENLFCKAFNAENLSRTDTAYDAKIDNIGIGIKTFVCPSNSKTEKIAEFDRKNSELKNLNVDKFVIKLSELRNERINFSKYGEVYIPIPAEIRKLKIGFFPERDKIFNLEIPSGDKLKAKICQDNGKALMTNPNIALANWLLKDVLQLKERELLTYKKLEIIGIDSVKIEKINNENYKIYFSKIGSYEKFINGKCD